MTAFPDADSALLNRGNKKAHNKHPMYFAEDQVEIMVLLKARGAK